MTERPLSFHVEGVGTQELSVQIFAVRINGKQMSAAIFKQFPTFPLCDENGNERENIIPWGIVRYETKGGDLWLLFREAGILHKASLSPVRKPDEAFQNTIDLWTRLSKNASNAVDVAQYQEHLRAATLAKLTEGKRSAVHTNALRYPQLFIGV